jgi:hypothetical protein
MKAQSFLSSAIGFGVLFAVALSAQGATEFDTAFGQAEGNASPPKFKEVLEKAATAPSRSHCSPATC